jgi:cytochrome c556
MRWTIGALTLVLATVVTARPQAQAARTPAAGGVKAVASVMDVMRTMTIPFSDAVFSAGSEPPKDEAGWQKVRDQAVALAESGNLLMMGTRVKDRTAWLKFSRAQVDAAEIAAKAAGAKNPEALATAADAVYETCANCHKVYLK